jgi:hypothetical protein
LVPKPETISKNKINLNSFQDVENPQKGDFKLALSRTELTQLFERATPVQWTKIMIPSCLMKPKHNQLLLIMYWKTYHELLWGTTSSRTGPILRLFKNPKSLSIIPEQTLIHVICKIWLELWKKEISDDRLIVELKKAFSPTLLPLQKLLKRSIICHNFQIIPKFFVKFYFQSDRITHVMYPTIKNRYIQLPNQFTFGFFLPNIKGWTP